MTLYEKDDIVIRTYEEVDIPSIIEFIRCDEIGKKDQAKFLLSNISSEVDEILVMLKNNKVIGMVYLMAYYDIIDILTFTVNSENQGLGYDKLLLDIIKSVANNEDRDIGYMGENEFLSNNGFVKNGIRLLWKHAKKDMGIPKIFMDSEKQKNMKDDFDAAKAAQELYDRGIRL